MRLSDALRAVWHEAACGEANDEALRIVSVHIDVVEAAEIVEDQLRCPKEFLNELED